MDMNTDGEDVHQIAVDTYKQRRLREDDSTGPIDQILGTLNINRQIMALEAWALAVHPDYHKIGIFSGMISCECNVYRGHIPLASVIFYHSGSNDMIKEHNKKLRIYFHSRGLIPAHTMHSEVVVSDSPCCVCGHPRSPWFGYCGGCQVTRYCSRTCQRVDWSNHCNVCDTLS